MKRAEPDAPESENTARPLKRLRVEEEETEEVEVSTCQSLILTPPLFVEASNYEDAEVC